MKSHLAWLLLVIFASCNKEDRPTADPRDAWVGSYHGIKTSTFWTMNQPSTTSSDTFSVVVKKDPNAAGYLFVGAQRVLPDANGYVSLDYSSGWRLWELQLGGDSLKLNTASGGLGGGTNASYRGKRMK